MKLLIINQFKLQNTLMKAFSTLIQAGKGVGKLIANHKLESLLLLLSSIAAIDDIRVRCNHKNDIKAFEENSIKQQQVVRKHEAEINALRAEAEQAHKTIRHIEQLESIINDTIRGGESA